MKICTMCGHEKPDTEFHKRAASKDGLRSVCKPCNLRQAADWYSRNSDDARAADRDQYALDPEKGRGKSRGRHAQNPVLENLRAKKWRSRFPDKVLIYNRRARALKKGATIAPISVDFHVRALEAWDHRCAYCRTDLRAPGVKTEWDHFRPYARGGAHAEYNLVPVCRSCNSSKWARDPFVFLFDLRARIGISSSAPT